ncbi:unnamed protein product [Cuscuta europaea]|uniref:Uncharacterized protein n=1 Tax=Cuscuta europaea TaxID=41803 RepID=A0A9P1EL80_CUSEU|nr:unnamed protein product [Cuscuta europaea]
MRAQEEQNQARALKEGESRKRGIVDLQNLVKVQVNMEVEQVKNRLNGGASGSVPPGILIGLGSEVVPLEVTEQTCSPFSVVGLIKMSSLEVVDKTSSSFLVAGKIGMTYLEVADKISSSFLVADLLNHGIQT